MAFGDWVQGNNKDAGSVTSTTLLVGTVTAGNSIVVGVRRGGATADTVTVTDDKNAGNYTLATAGPLETSDPHGDYVFFYPRAAAGATTITVTFTGAAKTMRLVCGEYVGNFAVHGTPAQATGTSTTPSSGNQTTTATCAIIGVITNANSGATFTAGTGFTTREQAGAAAAINLEDQNGQQVAGTYAATGTMSGSQVWGATLVCFAPASAAVADSPQPLVVAPAFQVRPGGPQFRPFITLGDQTITGAVAPAAVALSSLDATTQLPAPAVVANAVVVVPAVAAAAVLPAPAVVATVQFAAPALAATTVLPAPAVVATAVVAVPALAATTVLPAPAVVANAVVAVSAVAATVVLPAPTITTQQVGPCSVSVPAVAATAVLPAPAVVATVAAAVPAVPATTQLPAPTVVAKAAVPLSVVAAAVVLPAPAVVANVVVGVPAVDATAVIPAPTITASGIANASVSLTPVAAAVTLPAPVVVATVRLAATAVATTTQLPAPTVTLILLAAVTVGPVNATAGLPGPVVAAQVVIAAGPVTATVTIPVPAILTLTTAFIAVPAVAVTVVVPDPPIAITGIAVDLAFRFNLVLSRWDFLLTQPVWRTNLLQSRWTIGPRSPFI